MTSERTPSPTVRPLLVALLAPLTVLFTGCRGPNLLERLGTTNWGLWGTVIIVLDLVALIDLLSDETRETTGIVIWALLIIFFPVGGVLLYFFVGRD